MKPRRWRLRYRLVLQNRAKFVGRAGGPGRMLIFGLGNLPYPRSRHSVGQIIIEGLAARFGVRLAYEPKIQAFHGSIEGLEMPGSPNNKRLKVSFAKTKNLMNISGPSVKQTYETLLHHTQTFHPRNRRIIIIHDSIDQAPFKISPRFGGSARGHNGVRSVISSLGTQDFYRIRIGIGAPPQRGMLEQFVLGRLSQEELEYWQPGGEGIERVWEAVVKIIEDEIEVGNEERKLNPRKDLPQFAAVPAPFGNKTHKQLWEQKFLPETLRRHARRGLKIAEAKRRISEELRRQSWREERNAAMTERLERMRQSLQGKP